MNNSFPCVKNSKGKVQSFWIFGFNEVQTEKFKNKNHIVFVRITGKKFISEGSNCDHIKQMNMLANVF